MSEALLDKKFEYWQNQLLDLGKRNRMINYRETKRATLKLVEPGFEELFRRVAVDEDELTFQSPIDKNSDIRTYSLLSLLETLSCPIPVNIGDIKTEGSILERQKTLKQLRSKSRWLWMNKVQISYTWCTDLWNGERKIMHHLYG